MRSLQRGFSAVMKRLAGRSGNAMKIPYGVSYITQWAGSTKMRVISIRKHIGVS
jgi:hypothetical protein